MSAKRKILELLRELDDLSVLELQERLPYSKQSIHVTLRTLMAEGEITKLGKTPKTIYKLADRVPNYLSEPKESYGLPFPHDFLQITELGQLIYGIQAFSYWCKKRNLPTEKTIREYEKTLKKYDSFRSKKGIITGFQKLKNTAGFSSVHLDALYYLDFYAIERFGKTSLGTLMHFAKQGQNEHLMERIVERIKESIAVLVKESKFDAVAFVPPTIKRELQIMKYLNKHLAIALPHIEVHKINGIIPVPQKSLSKIDERISNANHTFTVSKNRRYSHVLLIDDAVGSGATLNQIALKIKRKKVAKKVTGLAIVGSFKGFDVITDI